MSLQSRLSALITVIKTETKNLRVLISGSTSGDVSALNTTATNLVAAINEVKGIADAAGTGNASINDAVTELTSVWSSQKVSDEITAAIVAALEGEDLSDLADAIAANAAAQVNLVNQSQFNTLETTVNAKANASDVYTQTELGDPETDLVALWNAA